jgi:CBS domain-containing protein
MRVVAQNLSPELTLVEKVMTVNPDFATLDTTILDALHIMHDGKFLHIPVLDRGRALFMSLRPKRTITKHLLGLYYLMLVLHFPQQKDKLLLAWMSCNLPTQPFNWLKEEMTL